MALIAPSLVAADFARLGEALNLIKEAGASMVHVDVTDGHFVPDITMGPPVIQSLRKATDLVLDVHLQIERPERFAADFLTAGADRLAVHVEGTLPLARLLKSIRGRGAKAGVAINPSTPVGAVSEVLGDIDFLTILASESELGVRHDLARTLARLRQASKAREEGRYEFALQVEGGAAGFENELVQAGADILVAGSDIFEKDRPRERLVEIMRRAAASRQVA
jgi:ribulose-phosphate 3-epimerase